MNTLDGILRRLDDYKDQLENLRVTEKMPYVKTYDYSATSTIVGWSSFTMKLLVVGRVADLAFVTFDLRGTSNSTAVTFTLPWTLTSLSTISTCKAINNAGIPATGMVVSAVSGNTITIYATLGASAWTNTGTKEATGQAFYILP